MRWRALVTAGAVLVALGLTVVGVALAWLLTHTSMVVTGETFKQVAAARYGAIAGVVPAVAGAVLMVFGLLSRARARGNG